MPDPDRIKMHEVLMVLHECTMDHEASEFELSMARLRKAATPGFLEFIYNETRRQEPPSVQGLVASMLIFFGEFAAKVVHSYSELTADEAWAIAGKVMGDAFICVYKQCSDASETQNGETDHPAQNEEQYDHV
jgi:hypothetical protein